MSYRVCAGCNHSLSANEFSKNQMRKPSGVSRCSLCIQENVKRDGSGFGTGRSNETSRKAVFEWDEIYASGTFRHCVLGNYTSGPRTGQKAIAKYFKPQYRRMSASFFETDEAAVEKALQIISSFNGSKFISKMVRINVPQRWTKHDGENVFVEPFIEGFEKFNSNSGWISKKKGNWYDLLQAFSHYSYHLTRGQFLLCDLQGGIFRNGVILTDPVVCSRSRRFGPPDLGPEGISTFFGRHRCNQFCRNDWTKPKDCGLYYRESEGTSMEYTETPVRQVYLPSMTFYEEEDEDDDSDSYY